VTTPLLVDLDHAAKMLSISRRSVQQIIYNGALPSVTVGRRRLIASADLEAFVDQLRQDSGRPELKVV
jgi:excisionase family DNA binding protein